MLLERQQRIYPKILVFLTYILMMIQNIPVSEAGDKIYGRIYNALQGDWTAEYRLTSSLEGGESSAQNWGEAHRLYHRLVHGTTAVRSKEAIAAIERLQQMAEVSGSTPTIDNGRFKLALVIGNANYRHAGTLRNPINDATDIAKTLKSIGFRVILGIDLDKGGMNQNIQEFARALSRAQVGLFFYAGHGLQVDGKNYLVPIDAKLDDPSGIDFELIKADLIQGSMERATQTNIIFLDACRNNPLARNLARAMGTRSVNIGRGLAVTESGAGTLISFSTQPGNVALDGTDRNSPFAAALTRHITTPGEALPNVLIKVRRDVIAATNGRQVPWEHSALTDHLTFVSAKADEKSGQSQHEETSIAPNTTTSGLQEKPKYTTAESATSRQTAVAECAALAPTNTQDLKESFRGEIEGRLDGIVGKLVGGMANLEGEYNKVVEDTLKQYPESHRLYVWQRLIYLACVNKESGLDLNDLAKAYLVGPSLFGSSKNIQESDLQIQLVGFDRAASIDTVGHYAFPRGMNARFPDMIFLLTNSSRQDIHVSLDECSLMDFKYPEPIRINSFGVGSGDTISALTGTARIFAVGSPVVRIPAGQRKYMSYGIGLVDAPSFEARQQHKSICIFRVGDGTVLQPREVEVLSPRKYLSQ